MAHTASLYDFCITAVSYSDLKTAVGTDNDFVLYLASTDSCNDIRA